MSASHALRQSEQSGSPATTHFLSPADGPHHIDAKQLDLTQALNGNFVLQLPSMCSRQATRSKAAISYTTMSTATGYPGARYSETQAPSWAQDTIGGLHRQGRRFSLFWKLKDTATAFSYGIPILFQRLSQVAPEPSGGARTLSKHKPNFSQYNL